MTEKEMLLTSREREAATTLKCIRNFPDAKLDEHWAEKLRTPRELIATLIREEDAYAQIATGNIDWNALPNVEFTSVEEAAQQYEAALKKSQAGIGAVSDEDLNNQMDFAGMKLRRLDGLWMMAMDHIHHRGQFTVMLRLAGAKVPQIYGPSADEPMM